MLIHMSNLLSQEHSSFIAWGIVGQNDVVKCFLDINAVYAAFVLLNLVSISGELIFQVLGPILYNFY